MCEKIIKVTANGGSSVSVHSMASVVEMVQIVFILKDLLKLFNVYIHYFVTSGFSF